MTDWIRSESGRVRKSVQRLVDRRLKALEFMFVSAPRALADGRNGRLRSTDARDRSDYRLYIRDGHGGVRRGGGHLRGRRMEVRAGPPRLHCTEELRAACYDACARSGRKPACRILARATALPARRRNS